MGNDSGEGEGAGVRYDRGTLAEDLVIYIYIYIYTYRFNLRSRDENGQGRTRVETRSIHSSQL